MDGQSIPQAAGWPCATYGTALGYQDCPGISTNRIHCTACHRISSGYVALCPMHDAAPDLLAAAKAALFPAGDTPLEVSTQLLAAIAKAEGRS